MPSPFMTRSKQGPALVLALALLAVVSYVLLAIMGNADMDARNKQVLVDTFRNLVRYAFLKTNRDLVRFGVTPGDFSVDALTWSLSARANAGIFAARMAPTLRELLQRAREPDLPFHFYWTASSSREPLEAAFGISYQPDGDLKVRLLWLGLPERIPISPQMGAVNGRKPLEEAVTELVRVRWHGQLVPYPSPQ